MRIVLIGAGNLATHLGLALKESGHEVVQVYSRTEVSAKQLACRLDSIYITDLSLTDSSADLYIFSIKDCVLEEVVSKVCKKSSKAVYLHTAGSMPMDIFKPYADLYGVLYPMQTFSKEREVDFKQVPLFVEGNNERAKKTVEILANGLSKDVTILSSADRKYLHLAAVWACNFTNHCYAMAADVLEKHGIPFSTMFPLIDETAKKVHEMGPKGAQTGPALRYDKNVINKQIELMGDNKLQQDLYTLLSKSIHQTNMENNDK